jgi:DNA-binding IclR family transcriptional regulator
MAESWSFVTKHLEVLIAVDHDRDVRLRDLADQLGITERTAHGIVADLTRAGFISVSRVGRRNRYEVHKTTLFRDRRDRQLPVGVLLGALAEPA